MSDLGDKEKQVRALRETRYVQRWGRKKIMKSEIEKDYQRNEIELLRAEVKRLKRELAKAHKDGR